jgi:hypothetical protein
VKKKRRNVPDNAPLLENKWLAVEMKLKVFMRLEVE